MSSNLNGNCDGYATGCRKLYFSSAGCHKRGKVGKHSTKRWDTKCWSWNTQRLTVASYIAQCYIFNNFQQEKIGMELLKTRVF